MNPGWRRDQSKLRWGRVQGKLDHLLGRFGVCHTSTLWRTGRARAQGPCYDTPMTDKKTIKRAVKAVWDDVKGLRSSRGKSYDAAGIGVVADELTAHAAKLKELASELSKLSPMPAGEPQAPRTKKRKAKKRAKAD